MPKISIIVPVYNVEEFLPRCINSILNQSFKNIELILVNDGSTDNCGLMCEEYKKTDNRIKVIHKKNGGVSQARNYGLDVAEGKYIAFCDSDDWIKDDWLENLYCAMEKNGADSVVGNFQIASHDGNIQSTSNMPAQILNVNSESDRLCYLASILSHKFSWEIYLRLYSNETIRKNKIRFCESCENFAEDLGFVLEYALYENKIAFVDYAGYMYFLRDGSMMDKSKELIKLNQLNEVSYFYSKAFKKMFNRKTYKKFFPMIHFCLINNQLIKLEQNGKLRIIKEEIRKIEKLRWFKKNMKKIKYSRKNMNYFGGIEFVHYAIPMANYCIHKKYLLFRIEKKLIKVIVR